MVMVMVVVAKMKNEQGSNNNNIIIMLIIIGIIGLRIYQFGITNQTGIATTTATLFFWSTLLVFLLGFVSVWKLSIANEKLFYTKPSVLVGFLLVNFN